MFKGDVLLKPIVAAGGKDISNWFDIKTKDVSYHEISEYSCSFDCSPNQILGFLSLIIDNFFLF